jgi:TonB-dependent receptor
VIRFQSETAPPTSFDYISGYPPDTPVFSLFDTDYRPDAEAPVKGPPRDTVNQKAYGYDVFAPVVRFTDSDAIVVAADLDKAWSTGDIPSLFKVGFQYDSRNIEGYLDAGYNYVNGLNLIASENGVNWDPDSYLSDKKWVSDFPLGFDVYYYDYEGFNDHLFRVLGELEAVGAYDPSQDQLETNHYNLSEDILSVFAMNSWTFENSTFVAGLRMESVALKNHGFPGVGGSVDAIDQDQDYTNLFPSLHYNVDLKENLKLRVAGVSGISRPGFSQIRLGVGIDDNQDIVHIGNPELVAETAYGFDLSLEWYFETAALLSVGAYYRQVDDVLYDFSTEVGDDRYDSDGEDRSGYEYRTTLNGGTGHLSGLELSYMQRWPGLPGFLDGLGMQFSMALMDGEFEGPNGRKVRFPGTSDMLVNASLFYENYGFSIRLSYQWRDSWVDDLNWESESDFFWAAYDQLDFSLRYQLSRSVSFFFDANNLTESRTVRYKGERQYPVEVEGFGSRYMFGVRGVF